MWDAEINRHDVRFLTFVLSQTDGKTAVNFKSDFTAPCL
jgi:hypothetical protein